MSSYQGKLVTYTQSQALSHQYGTLSPSSSQEHLPLYHQYQQHDRQEPHQLLMEMELADLLTTTSATGLPSQDLLFSLPPSPFSQHRLTFQNNDIDMSLTSELAHIPPELYAALPLLRDDENNTNSNNDPFMSCPYYPASAVPLETNPIEPPLLTPRTSQRNNSQPSSTSVVGYHSTTLSPIADGSDSATSHSTVPIPPLMLSSDQSISQQQ